jgi:hypothetical protein
MLTATEKRIVKKARGLITPEERWTQDVFAAARGGHAVDPQDAEAFKFCALGALWRAAFELGERGFKVAGIISKLTGNPGSLQAINDGPDGHRRVLALFDKALAE